MPGMELTGFEPRLDQIAQKVQELRDRKRAEESNSLDEAMSAVEQNSGAQERQAAHLSLDGLRDELLVQQQAAHALDPAKVAMLIADPFDD